MSNVESAIFRMERALNEMLRMQVLASTPALRDPKSLQRFGFKVYSQNEEDGIIAEIFRRIGATTRTFVEFGVENGLECNSTYLLIQGWKGVWIEGSAAHYASIQKMFEPFIAKRQLSSGHGFVTAERIEEFFTQLGVPAEFDLLSIDIDNNDYWVWKAISHYSPRVVIIEYNASFGPELDWKVVYRPDAVWDRATRNFGASLKAMENLGREKGYSLVTCNFTGSNAFFVRNDLVGDKFQRPFTSELHWQPGRYNYIFPGDNTRSPMEFEHFR